MKGLVWSALAMAAVSVSTAAAQMHAVKKPETVVRAVAVYEWTGPEAKPTASRLVPVSIFIYGELEDAGVYLAQPVPLALDTGTVFALERSGEPEGLLTIAYERHLQSTGEITYDDGWLGYGAFQPMPKNTYVAGMQKGPLSPVLVNGKPVGGSSPGIAARTPVDRSGAASGKVSTTGSVGVDADDDSSEPVLVRKPVTPATSTANAPDTSTDPTDPSDRPTLKRRDPDQTANTSNPNQKKTRRTGDQASVRGVGSLNDDPDRPVLHRGAPAGQLDEDSLPPLVGLPSDMHQMVAVSDAKERDPHDFVRPWQSDAERLEVLAQMETAARARLARYDALTGISKAETSANAAPALPPRTSSSASTYKKTAKQPAPQPPAPAPLNDEQLRGYLLSYGGADTFVYTASAPASKGGTQYITVIAQREAGNEPKIALTSVTDSAHLDRTPWMRLVDAVDAEASNRASLLFELRAQQTRQFTLYRVIGAQAEQSLVTGSNP